MKPVNNARLHAGKGKPARGLFRTVRARLIVCFCLLFVAILAGVKYIAVMGCPLTPFTGRQGQRKTEAFGSLNLIADIKKDRLVRWVEERRDDSRVIAESPLVRTGVAALRAAADVSATGGVRPLAHETANGAELLEFLVLTRDAYGAYARIRIADAGTGTILVSTDEVDVGAGISKRPYFVDALWSRSICVSDIEMDPQGQWPVLTVSNAIVGPDDEVLAVLVMEINAEEVLKPMLHTGEGLGKRGEALLVNEDTRILTSLKHPLPGGHEATPLQYRINALPAVLAACGEEGIIEGEDYRGEAVLAAYRHIRLSSEWGWGMVVQRNREELLAPLRQDIVYAVWIGISGILIVMGLTFAMAMNITRPILALSRTAERVSDGDLQIEAPVTTRDEVGRLALTFNAMIRHVRRSHEELERSNEELEQFAYAASHDLQEPLRKVTAFGSLLQSEYGDQLEDDGLQYVQTMQNAAQRMQKLINDLLTYSRVTTRGKALVPVDLNETVQSVLSDLETRFDETKATVDVDDLPTVLADPTQMYQLLQNLIGNALKFHKERDCPHVKVHTESHPAHAWDTEGLPASYASIAVEDNGIGFDEKYTERIFGVFQRLHLQHEYSGSGIGLAVCRRIVERHGGAITVRSKPGEGSTFTVSLPAEQAEEEKENNA